MDELWQVLGGDPGWFGFCQADQTVWCDVRDHRRFGRLSRAGGEVSAVAFTEQSFRHPARASVLWARTETGKATEALLGCLLPKPTLLLREGDTCRHVGLWALSQSLTPSWLELGNRRLAHAVGGAKKHASPWFTVPLPGTSVGRGQVRVEAWSGELYEAGDVVGGLPDPPVASWQR